MISKTQQRFKSDSGFAYTVAGSGPAIVLVHGVGLRAEAWQQQVDALSQHNTVYALDMPGHGQSELLSNPEADLQAYVDAIASWIASEVKAPVILMGHSMGSMIALHFAVRYPQWCRGAVALNAVYRRTEAARQAVQARAKAMLENPQLDRVSTPIARWFSENPQGFEREMAELCASWLEAAPAVGYARAYGIFSRSDSPSDQALAEIEAPVAYITGDGDANSSPQMSQQMAALTPHGSAHVIEHSRHMVQLTHPAQINQLLLDFVARCQCESTHTKTHAGV
ncbi:MAG: alpha/beta fold hydrolase [Pseudomonadales bacterium]